MRGSRALGSGRRYRVCAGMFLRIKGTLDPGYWSGFPAKKALAPRPAIPYNRA